MINNLGCGSSIALPIFSAIGTRSTAAIVWEMLFLGVRLLTGKSPPKVETHNVAITKAIPEKKIRIV